jgi:hypothetical protein
MQTERVTFLTSRDNKAALDAFASRRGESVGNVLREAASRYIGQGEVDEAEREAELEALTRELEDALPEMQANLESMQRSIADARMAIRDALDSVEKSK